MLFLEDFLGIPIQFLLNVLRKKGQLKNSGWKQVIRNRWEAEHNPPLHTT